VKIVDSLIIKQVGTDMATTVNDELRNTYIL